MSLVVGGINGVISGLLGHSCHYQSVFSQLYERQKETCSQNPQEVAGEMGEKFGLSWRKLLPFCFLMKAEKLTQQKKRRLDRILLSNTKAMMQYQ